MKQKLNNLVEQLSHQKWNFNQYMQKNSQNVSKIYDIANNIEIKINK